MAKLYIMSHYMFPNQQWIVTCPYKWLKQNNKDRVEEGEEAESIEEFSWIESEVVDV